ncbi:MAG: GNAT family N-acetyltransferase [Marinifilaceae bacterium]
MIKINPSRTDMLVEQLVSLWELSVKASHLFLTNTDIEQLTPFAEMGLQSIETLVVKYNGDIPTAFMGIEDNKIEMLFVHPEYFGKGIGKELVKFAIKEYNVQYVDVNEQNPAAVGFYKHLGFLTTERTEHDEQGNPFPILKMRLHNFTLRTAQLSDVSELAQLFHDTVMSVNARHYSTAEIMDWASCGDNISRWEEIILTHHVMVAVNSKSGIVGFAAIASNGYLNSLFVHKDFQGVGIATTLLNHIEEYAKINGNNKITSEVSITAKSFFEKRGYKVLCEQRRQARNLQLTNYKMSLQLK